MPEVSEALARIQARVAAVGDPAPPVNPPADPMAQSPGDVETRLADLEAAMADMSAWRQEIEQSEIEEAIAEADEMGEAGMMAALPEPAEV